MKTEGQGEGDTPMLPYDIARCAGKLEGDTLRKDCGVCLRRTAKGRDMYQTYISPRVTEGEECPYFISGGGSQ